MDFLKILILYGAERLTDERSISAIYSIIVGKKSSQTIQDVSWFRLKKWYHCFPNLSKATFDESVSFLIKNGFIFINEKTVSITPSGKKALQENLKNYPPLNHLNGYEYFNTDEKFWCRLNLIVQSLSYLVHNDSSFYPVERKMEIQYWVKKWLNEKRKVFEKDTLFQMVREELFQIFSKMEKSNLQPSLVVYRLSGYKSPGLTSNQLSQALKIEEVFYQLSFLDHIHYMLKTIWSERENYPLLHTLFEYRNVLLTSSSEQTYELIKKGYSIDEIVKIRRLKRSTIEDHVVEIVLKDPTFSIDPFVSLELQNKLVNLISNVSYRKLSKLKEDVKEADYFAIRLVLSKYS